MKLARFLRNYSCTQRGRRQAPVGNWNRGWPSARRGSQGSNVGGHSAPFFCPRPRARGRTDRAVGRSSLRARATSNRAGAGLGRDGRRRPTRTEQGGSVIPRRGPTSALAPWPVCVEKRRCRSVAVACCQPAAKCKPLMRFLAVTVPARRSGRTRRCGWHGGSICSIREPRSRGSTAAADGTDRGPTLARLHAAAVGRLATAQLVEVAPRRPASSRRGCGAALPSGRGR